MSLDAIKELPVPRICAETAHLYLWTPNALLPEGIEVLRAWGFRYKSNIVWHKVRKDGGSDGRDVGLYFGDFTLEAAPGTSILTNSFLRSRLSFAHESGTCHA
jgi:N6-adenosine-specific RNA methylase IME4